MANMVNYNGVDLPDINTVWTGVAKETCPYAVILGGEGEYDLVLTTLPIVADDAQQIELLACPLEDGEWGQAQITTYSGAELFGLLSETFIWSSYDICMSDGTVVFAGAVDTNPNITESKGDGFALYNGVKLPNIDAVWDKETYPSACILGAGGAYNLIITQYAIVKKPTMLGFAEGTSKACSYKYFTTEYAMAKFCEALGMTLEDAYAYGLKVGEWVVLECMSAERVADDVFWTSHDILNEDGSTYLAASDPIPLDGMNVIEWNGVTDGLVGLHDFGIAAYIVTDEPFAFTDGDKWVAVVTISALVGSYSIYSNERSGCYFVNNSSDGYGLWCFSIEPNEMYYPLALGANLPNEGIVGTGLYQFSLGDQQLYTTLFAYTPASTEPEEPDPDPGTDPEPEEPEPINPLVAAFWAGFAAGVPG